MGRGCLQLRRCPRCGSRRLQLRRRPRFGLHQPARHPPLSCTKVTFPADLVMHLVDPPRVHLFNTNTNTTPSSSDKPSPPPHLATKQLCDFLLISCVNT